MTEQQFVYWLQGFAELNDGCPPTAEQWKAIREHLATVFTKVTPRYVPGSVQPAMTTGTSATEFLPPRLECKA